jgi:hypothetical protein
MAEVQTVATTVHEENLDTTIQNSSSNNNSNGTASARRTDATVRKQIPRSCVSNSRVPSRTPSRSSQRSVTFSLHTPSRREPTYEESSQFNPAQLDTVSLSARRNSNIRASQGNLSNAEGPLVLYEQQPHPLMSTYAAAPYDSIPPPPPPMWGYPAPPPIPVYFCAPPPIDSKTMRKAMENAIKAEKRFQAKKDHSPCRQFCCGGIAKLLWVLIAFILIGCIAMVIMATMLL